MDVRFFIYLTREVLQQPVLKLVFLVLVAGLEQPQPGYLHVQVHLLFDARITGTQRLNFRERKRGLVRVLAGANGRLRGHYLRDELLLVFKRLPEIGVEGVLGDIPVYMDGLVHVALTCDAALALFEVAGTPWGIEVVEGDEPVLHVRPRAHLGRGANQHTHIAGAHFGEQLLLLSLRVRRVDEGYLALRDATGNEVVRYPAEETCSMWT